MWFYLFKSTILVLLLLLLLLLLFLLLLLLLVLLLVLLLLLKNYTNQRLSNWDSTIVKNTECTTKSLADMRRKWSYLHHRSGTLSLIIS